MARQCSKCERGFLTSISRSHSHIATRRRQNVNLQVRRLDGDKVLVCAACIKASKKTKKASAK